VRAAVEPTAVLSSRAAVRVTKKLLRRAGKPDSGGQHADMARAAALALLDRSVRMRHKRLTLQRLEKAVDLGAAVSAVHWAYCESVATGCHDEALKSLLVRAAGRACFSC
jgi:hypothetical protein